MLYSTEFDSFIQAYFVTVVEDRHIYCLQNIVSHFWPKLSHLAAESICDNRATCYAIARPYSFSSAVHPASNGALDSAMVAT